MTLWRRFQDWREQRAVLKELKMAQQQDEFELMGDELNPLHLARLALERDQYELAASRWEDARERMPNFIYKSDDSLTILLGLKRYDEAEALMREGLRRNRHDRRWRVGLAQIAEHQCDYLEAVRRWKAAQAGGMADTKAWIHEGICLRALGRMDEAEAVYASLLRRLPNDLGATIELARSSDDRKDWVKAEERWGALAKHYNVGFVHAHHAAALHELGRVEEAEAVLAFGNREFPADLDIGITRAQLAERRGDLNGACERWAELQRVSPYSKPVFNNRAQCLFNAGRFEEADEVMRVAIERFPDEWDLLFEYARLAHRRDDWPAAVARWEAYRLRFPDKEEGYSWGRSALNAAGRHDEAALLPHGP